MTHTLHHGPCLLIGDSPLPEAHQATLHLLWQAAQVPVVSRPVWLVLGLCCPFTGMYLHSTTLN